jgi:carbon monoxide dehydrogenase subunit G
MFVLKAGFSDRVEVKTNIKNVRNFFSNIQNFVELMPSLESIHIDGKGTANWKIRAEVPFVGSFIQYFKVELSSLSDARMEWSPLPSEKENFLRYFADFEEIDENTTFVQFTQNVEVRRKNATDLHLLAGLAGEGMISREMSKKIAEMLKIFVKKAKEKLEK